MKYMQKLTFLTWKSIYSEKKEKLNGLYSPHLENSTSFNPKHQT